MRPDRRSGPHVSAGAATGTTAKRSAPILPDRGESDEAFALRVSLNADLWDAYLLGLQYGRVEGLTEGRRQVEDELWQGAVEVASNAAKSITTATVTGLALGGTDEQLRAAAEHSRARSVKAFRVDHARRRAKHLTVYDDGTDRYVLLRGPVRDLLREHQVPAVRAPIERGWRLRRERLADLLAIAQESGYAVKVDREAMAQ